MTDLEMLQKIRNEKYQLAEIAQNKAKEGYEGLIRNALEKNNFNMDLIYRMPVDVSSREPDDNWCRDFIEVDIKKDDKSYELDIYIKGDRVEFNNCCSGNWTADSLYHEYIKMMSIIASDVAQSLLDYSKSINRQPLKDADEAYYNVEREQRRIRDEEYQAKKQAKINELDGAEFIARYRKLKSWEDGYVEGEDRDTITHLYRVIKRTPKYFIVDEYFLEYANIESTERQWMSRWYSEERIKKDVLYVIGNGYKAVNKDELDILEN